MLSLRSMRLEIGLPPLSRKRCRWLFRVDAGALVGQRAAPDVHGNRFMAEKKSATGSPEDSAMRVDAALVQQLAELLTANELTEIEVEDGERRIKVKRETPAMIAAATMGPAF